MNYDKAQFRELMESRDELNPQKQARKQPAGAGLSAYPELLRQAAVKSEALTRDENWNNYLSRIQKDIEGAESMLAQARATLEDPKVMAYEDLMRAKTVVLESKAIINALNIAISYPVHIIEAHKKQKDLQKK